MKIIGEDEDIKRFTDEIDYEDSEIYLGPSDIEKTRNLWVEPEDLKKSEKTNEKKVKFFTIKNTYEYPHEQDNTKIEKKEVIKKKDKKSVNDDELTESERKRLEEVRMRRKEAEEMAKYKKEKEKEKEEENRELNKQREDEEKKRKERQERNEKLIKNKKKKKKK